MAGKTVLLASMTCLDEKKFSDSFINSAQVENVERKKNPFSEWSEDKANEKLRSLNELW